MNKLNESLSEIIPVGSHKKVTYSLDEQIKTLKLLAANRNIDPVIESIHEIFVKHGATGDKEEIALAVSSINRFLESHFEVLDEITIRRRKKRRKPNSKLSRIAKMRYRKNRGKIKRSLKKFHKSAKGKSFHKALGKYVARKRKGKTKKSSIAPFTTREELLDLMVSANSAWLQLGVYLRDSLAKGEQVLTNDELVEIQEIYNAAISDIFTALTVNEDEQEDYLEEVSGELANLFTEYQIDFEESEEINEAMTDAAHKIKDAVKPILLQAIETASKISGKTKRECQVELVELLNHLTKKP